MFFLKMPAVRYRVLVRCAGTKNAFEVSVTISSCSRGVMFVYSHEARTFEFKMTASVAIETSPSCRVFLCALFEDRLLKRMGVSSQTLI